MPILRGCFVVMSLVVVVVDKNLLSKPHDNRAQFHLSYPASPSPHPPSLSQNPSVLKPTLSKTPIAPQPATQQKTQYPAQQSHSPTPTIARYIAPSSHNGTDKPPRRPPFLLLFSPHRLRVIHTEDIPTPFLLPLFATHRPRVIFTAIDEDIRPLLTARKRSERCVLVLKKKSRICREVIVRLVGFGWIVLFSVVLLDGVSWCFFGELLCFV